MASWYHRHLYNPTSNIFVSKWRPLGSDSPRLGKKQQTNPAGLTNASHGKRVVQQNPKTDSVATTLVYHTTPTQFNTWQYLLRFSQWNLQESPQESPGISGFPSEDLDRSCWWFGTQYTLVLLSWRQPGGSRRGLGIWKEVGDLGMMIIVCYFSIWCAYICLWYVCIYRSCTYVFYI